MGAVSFIETMDHTSLSNITQVEFEQRVEEAIQALPPSEPESPAIPNTEPSTPHRASPHAGEESAQPLSLATPNQTFSGDARRLLQKTGDTISKPLNAIGRIFSEALDGAESKFTYLPGPFAPLELGRESRIDRPAASGAGPPPVPHWSHPEQVQQYEQQLSSGLHSESPGRIPQTPVGADGTYDAPIQTPYKPRVRRMPSGYSSSPGSSPGYSPGYLSEDTPSRPGPYTHNALTMGPSQSLMAAPRRSGPDSGHVSRTPTPNLDLAGIQAQIDTAHEHATEAARETLVQIFPAVDQEVIEWVLEANEGDLGRSIEGLLEMSSGE